VPNSSRRTAQTPERSFWKERWKNIEPAAGALVEDAMLMFIFVVALELIYLALGSLAALGYDSQRVGMFETIHYYAFLAVFLVFMVDMVVRVLLHAFRKQ
jgi:hypothetical protein